jgi:hypothetical protein
VALLQILVESIALGNELLLPLPESLFLDLDLLCESLAERLFLLLELWIVQFAWTSLTELAGFHLLCAVCLVVVLLGGMDQVKHVCADEDSAELLEVAVLLVLNFSNTPGVLSALDGTTVVGLDVLLGSDDGEWHSSDQAAGVEKTWFVILLEWWLVDLDALGLNDSSYLRELVVCFDKSKENTYSLLELCQIGWAQSISLCNDWDQVDSGAETLHDLNI